MGLVTFVLVSLLLLFLAFQAFCGLILAFLYVCGGFTIRRPRPEPIQVPKVADMPADIARLTQPMNDLQVMILAGLGVAAILLVFICIHH